MDLHALSEGRPMLVARGFIAFVLGVIVFNQTTISASTLVFTWGLWALAEGAATIWQAYRRSSTTKRAEATPLLIGLGGLAIVVGLLAVVGMGLSFTSLTWAMAGWLAVRALFELLGAFATKGGRRVVLGCAALVDVGLVAVLASHTGESVADSALFGGSLVAIWGMVLLVLAAVARPAEVATVAGPRLLATR
jgi:uncharacterized membrane protein HdeD (DUF308 family)